MKKLLVSDIDGTLFYKENQNYESVKLAIDEFVEQGNFFILATGRSVSSSLNVLNNLQINMPCIFLNGALLYDIKQKKVIKSNPIDCSVFSIMEKIFRENQNVSITYNTIDSVRTIRSNNILKKKATFEDRNAIIDDNIEVDDNILKILITSEDTKELRLLKEIINENKMFCAEFASNHFIEIVSSDSSKGKMLNYLLEAYNMDKDSVYVAGNGETDLSMKEFCCQFASPIDSKEKVLDSSDYIFRSARECGLVDFVFKLTSNPKVL